MPKKKQLEMFSPKEMGVRPIKPFDGDAFVQAQYVDETEKRQYELLFPHRGDKKPIAKSAKSQTKKRGR